MFLLTVYFQKEGEKGGSDRKRFPPENKTATSCTGVLEVRVGEVILSDRKIVDDSFDVGIFLSFASTGDMAEYITHPQHKKAVEEVLGPLMEKIVVYDFAE